MCCIVLLWESLGLSISCIGRFHQWVFSPVQVSLPELKEAIQNLLAERSERLSQLEDMKRVTEAAKRERVLAIDEKDKLLSK